MVMPEAWDVGELSNILRRVSGTQLVLKNY